MAQDGSMTPPVALDTHVALDKFNKRMAANLEELDDPATKDGARAVAGMPHDDLVRVVQVLESRVDYLQQHVVALAERKEEAKPRHGVEQKYWISMDQIHKDMQPVVSDLRAQIKILTHEQAQLRASIGATVATMETRIKDDLMGFDFTPGPQGQDVYGGDVPGLGPAPPRTIDPSPPTDPPPDKFGKPGGPDEDGANKDELTETVHDAVNDKMSEYILNHLPEKVTQLIGLEKPKDKSSKRSINIGATTSKTDLGNEGEYCWNESAWDLIPLIALPGIGCGSVALAIFINATVQGYLTYIIYRYFLDDPLSGMQDAMRQWRLTAGHDPHYIDVTEFTLLNRVCGNDLSLSMATFQRDMISAFDDYLGLDNRDQLKMDPINYHLSPGATMCAFILLIFCFEVMKDLRKICEFMLGLYYIPKGLFTEIQDGAFTQMARLRVHLAILMLMGRVTVDIILLYVGCYWLGLTDDLEDLLLNGVGLVFLLDIDETFWEVMLSSQQKRVVLDLQGLYFKPPPCNLIAVIPTTIAFGMVIISQVTFVKDSVEDMLAVKKTMCELHQNFVMDTARTGVHIGYLTRAYPNNYKESDLLADHVMAYAIDEVMNSGDGVTLPSLPYDPSIKYSLWAGRRNHLEEYDFFWQTIQDRARMKNYCLDLNAEDASGDDIHSVDYSLMMLLREKLMKDTPEKGWRQDITSSYPFKCEDYKPFCNEFEDGPIVNYVCPKTCGCHDPRSGIFRPEKGCPLGCLKDREEKLKNLECTNLAVGGDSSGTYADAFEKYMNAAVEEIENHRLHETWKPVLQGLRDKGCGHSPVYLNKPGASLSSVKNDAWLEFQDFCDKDTLHEYEYDSIVAFCPLACCGSNTTSNPKNCPTSCQPSSGMAAIGGAIGLR